MLPVVPALLDVLMPGASREAIAFHTGTLAAAYMLAIVALAQLWGAVSDRYSRRGVLLLGMGGHVLAQAAFPAVQSMAQAYALRFAAGAFAAAVLPAVYAAASDLENIEQRTARLAWLGSASLLGYLAGPAISGAVFELQQGAIEWPLYASAAVALLAFLFVYGGLPGAAGRTPLAAPTSTSGPYALVRVAVLSTAAMVGLGAFEVGLTVFASQRLQLGADVLALMFVECSGVMLIVQACIGLTPAVASRFATLIVSAAFAAMAAGFVALALTAGGLQLYLAVALIAAGSGALLPLLTFLASLRRTMGLGAAIGLQTAAANLGQAAGSAAGGWLYAIMNRESFWVYAAVMAIGAGAAARR